MAILTIEDAFWQSRAEEAEHLLSEFVMELYEKFEGEMDEETDNLIARAIDFLNRLED